MVEGICVPTIPEALRAAEDESLETPSYFHVPHRRTKIEDERGKRPTRGKEGESQISYLISRSTRAANGYDGFLLWTETWGRRRSYEVELHLVSYVPGGDRPGGPAHKLLEAMIQRLQATEARRGINAAGARQQLAEPQRRREEHGKGRREQEAAARHQVH